MKILVGVPTNRGVHPTVVQNLISFDLNSQKEHHAMKVMMPQNSLITQSRNLIMQTAIDEGFDWLLFQDDDTEICDNEFFAKLTKLAYEKDAAAVGIPVRLKGPSTPLNCAIKGPLGYANLQICDTQQEVDVCGTGVLLVNLHWMRHNWNKRPWFHVIDTETGAWPEDWYFCEEVKKRGGKIWVDGSIDTIHHGSYNYYAKL